MFSAPATHWIHENFTKHRFLLVSLRLPYNHLNLTLEDGRFAFWRYANGIDFIFDTCSEIGIFFMIRARDVLRKLEHERKHILSL